MQANWQIGSILGIPLYIDSSWFLILAFVTIINAGNVNASGLSNINLVSSWIAGFILAILLFVSVLLHELGHSIVAQNQGIKVNSISLFLFGGVASIDRESKTPEEALQVAIAGPTVSILLFGILSSIEGFSTPTSLFHFLLEDLARINLVLATFNLIPGLPLDGGQVLKAIVWKITSDRNSGMLWAARSGKVMGWMGISLGASLLCLTGEIAAIWISLIGWFVLRNAKNYEELTDIQRSLLDLVASDVMSCQFRVVNPNLTIRDFVDNYLLSETHTLPHFTASEGRYRGLIFKENLQLIEPKDWNIHNLSKIAVPLTEISFVEEKTPLIEVIEKLETINDAKITVVSPAGAVAGVIDRVDIIKAIAFQHNIEISEAEIKTTQSEKTYPNKLQLNAIAKAIQD